MHRVWRVSIGCLIASGLAAEGAAQTALTWQEAKTRFEATNPTLRADQVGIEEARAAEITAFLRPNPQVSATIDQIGHTDTGKPFDAALPSFSLSYLHERQEKRELRRDSAQGATAIADNMEEAVSGVKGELAVKIYGDDLRTLEAKGDQIVGIMRRISGIQDLGLFRVVGQPNLNLVVDRQQAARHQLNVADVQDAIQTAVGGAAFSQVLQGEQRYDLVLRYLPAYRDTKEAIERIRLVAPTGERVALAQLCNIEVLDGANEIYREGNSRYVAIKYSVRGRDLGSAVEEAIAKVGQQVTMPTGYRIDWAGEYESQQRSQRRLTIVLPITILIILIILYTMFNSFKWALLMLANMAMAPLGGLLALLLTGTHFSVSSGVGFLALFGVSVQTGVIMLEYINQLRARGHSIMDAAVEGAILRLRPIMMTTLVATLGLLPAAVSHGIGSDSQRPFAIVIVGGLMVGMAINIFLLPTLYVWSAGDRDVLPTPEAEFDETE